MHGRKRRRMGPKKEPKEEFGLVYRLFDNELNSSIDTRLIYSAETMPGQTTKQMRLQPRYGTLDPTEQETGSNNKMKKKKCIFSSIPESNIEVCVQRF